MWFVDILFCVLCACLFSCVGVDMLASCRCRTLHRTPSKRRQKNRGAGREDREGEASKADSTHCFHMLQHPVGNSWQAPPQTVCSDPNSRMQPFKHMSLPGPCLLKCSLDSRSAWHTWGRQRWEELSFFLSFFRWRKKSVTMLIFVFVNEKKQVQMQNILILYTLFIYRWNNDLMAYIWFRWIKVLRFIAFVTKNGPMRRHCFS